MRVAFLGSLAALGSLSFSLFLGCGSSDSGATGVGGAAASSSSSSSSSGTGGAGGASCGALTDCDGKCVDLNKDTMSCGVCGFACGAGEMCCEGACSTDCGLTINTVSTPQGPMSGATWITLTGKGFTTDAEVHLGKSKAPAKQVDAKTLLVLSPPGLAGAVDIQVTQGMSHATRGNAFRYASYGVEGTWQKINMSSPRGNWPGIAVLQDGRVLISGGVSTSMGTSVEDTADLYDPAKQMTTPTAGNMSAPRWTQASVTLFSGKTLVLGTWYGGFSPPGGPFADLFDPKTTTFAKTASNPFIEHRYPHAVMLTDGRVLIVDGAIGALDIYDPDKDSFSTAPPQTDLTGYRPARLLDGNVLLVKGGNAQALVFDPKTSTLQPAGKGPTASGGDLHTLPDGRVLYVAGSIPGANKQTPTDVLEIFDPAQMMMGFVPAPYKLAAARQHTLTTAMSGDGTVLVLGGEVGDQVLNPACSANSFVLTDTVERIDPVAGTVTMFDKLPEKNFVMSAATTLDGSIVAAGGAPCGGGMAYPYFYYLKGTVPPPPK
jgi:hypothetical protein